MILKIRSQMRAAQRGRTHRQQLGQKTFEECDWRQLVLGGEISKLKVFELDKLDKHNLLTGKKALKYDKVKCIISHLLRNDSSAIHTNAVACASSNTNKENAWMNQTRLTTTTMIMKMMMRGRIQKRSWS